MFQAVSIAPRLFLAAALALALAACQDTTRVGSSPPTGQTGTRVQPGSADPARPVTVALLAPLTAAAEGAADAGNALANAGRMAATDMADPALQLKIYDTAGTAEGARAAAAQAVADGAALILGPLFGANTFGVADIAAAAGINVVSFSTDSAVAGGPVFLSGFLPEAEAERIVGYAASQGLGRIGVFHADTAYGAAGLRGAEAVPGARVVVALPYARSFEGIQDASKPFASTAFEAGVSAILLPESGKGLQTVGAFMDYHGLNPAEVKYLGLGQWNASATLREPTLKGGWFPAPDPERVDVFANLYEARYGARPPFIAVLGYDAVQVAGQALAQARLTGSRTPFGRAELTRPEGFQGALGPLRFRPDGLSQRSMAILEVGERGFEVVDPAPGRLDLGS